MKRNQKKIESSIVIALTDVCETLKEKYTGFLWLTHFVDYANFAQSLKLVFVFDTKISLENAMNDDLFKTIFVLTESRLKRESVTVIRIDKAVYFDTEEMGADVDNMKWCRKYS